MIAIMMILSALLLPALGKSREIALRITCASKLKQIGAASFSYADDSNGFLPVGAATYSFFVRTLAPYLSYDDIDTAKMLAKAGRRLACPSECYKYIPDSDRGAIGVAPLVATYMATTMDIGAVPSFPQWGGMQSYTLATVPKRLSQVISGSAIMSETAAKGLSSLWGVSDFHGLTWPRPNENNLGHSNSVAQPPSFYAPFYHSMSSNYLFVDGHVSNYRCGQWFDGNWRPQ